MERAVWTPPQLGSTGSPAMGAATALLGHTKGWLAWTQTLRHLLGCHWLLQAPGCRAQRDTKLGGAGQGPTRLPMLLEKPRSPRGGSRAVEQQQGLTKPQLSLVWPWAAG